MTKASQDERIVIRLEPRLMELMRDLVAERKTGGIAAYVRGLIVADAVKQGKKVAGIDVPGWVTDTLVELRVVQSQAHPHPRTSGSSPTGESGSGGKPNESSADEGKAKSSKKAK